MRRRNLPAADRIVPTIPITLISFDGQDRQSWAEDCRAPRPNLFERAFTSPRRFCGVRATRDRAERNAE
jgi:hypothetical protein